MIIMVIIVVCGGSEEGKEMSGYGISLESSVHGSHYDPIGYHSYVLP